MKRPKFSYANVVSTLCLFILLGGGAYAAAKLAKNSVGPKQIRNGAVSLKKISKAAQKALKGQQGDTGAQGPAGPTFGAVQAGNSSFVYDPPANPDESTTAAAANGRAFNFNLPNAGNAYIRFFTADEGTSCNPVSNSQAGLYLDGAPIAHTERAIGTSVSPSTHDYVAIVQAAAGPHTAAVREDCPNGALSSNVQSADPDWTVLLLGG